MAYLSKENLANNQHWGDALEPKTDRTFRVYGQNVNGLTLDRRGGQFDALCRVIKEVQADVMCGQEHQLDTAQYPVKSILYQTCKQHWQRSRMNFGTTAVPFKAMYKPGGTFITTVGNATGRIQSQTADELGRWVSQTFQGAAGRRITFISAYQVVSDVVQPGTTTAASQQKSMLIQRNDPIQAPRKAFRRDLTAFLQKCKHAGDEIMLMGDFNEVMGDDPEGMTAIAQKLELFDVMGSRHTCQPPVTYSRGRRCLDYGLATPAIIQAITRCGYEQFHSRQPSDHRAYFFDLDIDRLFGTQIQPLSKFEPRLLHSTNTRQVTEYIRQKFSALLACNAFERGERLTKDGNRHAFAERLDSDVTRLSLSVEKSITKFNTPEWSVALASGRKQEQILKKGLSLYRHRCEVTNELRQEYANHSIEPFPSSLVSCSAQLRKTKALVRSIAKQSFEQREQEREDRILELEQSSRSSDKTRASLLRKIRYAEKARQLAFKLKMVRKSEVKVGMTRIEIPVHPDQDPKTCTEWRLVDIPSEVLNHLQQRNRKHFSQALGTPFTVPPLSTDFGFTGTGESAQQALSGQYIYPGENATTALRLLLDHLKQTAEMENQASHPTISEDAFSGKLKVWRESTSTSPSGLHLGHYKSLIARHQYSEVDQNDNENLQSSKSELDMMQRELRTLHLRLMNYALARGYSYHRWQTVANSMIFKEAGNIKIHRTRVIHIYEADFNLCMGLKWRSAVFQSEKMNELHQGQFGGRTRCTASDPVLIEEVQMDISRVTRKTLVQTNHDATSCYDRIIPNLAMVASQKFGVSPTATEACAATLEKAEYRIRTDLGLSPTGYHHSSDHPIFGTGQGSAFSPAIWLFLSCILYTCYEKLTKAAAYCCPDRSHQMEIGMIGFVDDNNDQTNNFLQDEDSETLPLVLAQTQCNAQSWNDLLTASGGALELTKCSYHVVHWKFAKNGSPVLVSLGNDTPRVYVQDSPSSQPQQLQLLSPYTHHKTLGHFKEPAGTQKEQYRQLKQRIDDTVAFLWKVPLTRTESWTFYYAYYLPSITYPLSSSHFTSSQLDTVQRTALCILLARCGYNRNMKRAVVFGPSEYGGAGFLRLYDHQGISQVTTFIRHWRKGTVLGQLLRVLVTWCNYSVGMSTSVVTDVHTPLPHLESKWLGSLRQYLASVDAWIETDDSCLPPLERVNDEYIMERIVRSQTFSAAQIRTLNYCRLYLGAVTLSDLTTTTGRYLDQSKVAGRPSLLGSNTKWLKVNQESPSEAEWRVWKRANRLWSTADGKMIRPLGPWLRRVQQCRIQCPAYGYNEYIAIKSGNEYEMCTPHQDGYFYPSGRNITVNLMPPSAVPVDVEEFGDNAWKLLKRTVLNVSPSGPFYATFPEYIESLPAWEVDLLRHTSLFVDPRMTCFSLQPHFYAGCDGSSKFSTNGAFGWTISTHLEERAATGMGPSRGAVMDSYRAECSGLLSILRFLIRLSEFSEMYEPWSGVIGTDSQSMIDKVFEKVPVRSGDHPRTLAVLDPIVPEWDLLVEIQSALRILHGVSVIHVKGHQDSQRSVEQLPLMSQLNVEADALATLYQNQFGSHRTHVIMSPNAGAHLVTSDGTVTAKYKDVLLVKSSSPALRKYIQEKNNWTEATMEMVNWSDHGKTFRSQTHCRVHLSKMLHECLPTFHQLNKYGGNPRKCPACSTADETRDHIIRCVVPSRLSWRAQFWEAMDKFHSEYRTAPVLIYVFRSAMEEWLQSDADAVINPTLYPSEVRELVIQQNVIGWRQVFNGRFSIEWSRIQQEYYSKHRTKPGIKNRNGSQWQVKLMTLIWEQWRKVWKERNQEVHGQDEAERSRAERANMSRELREVYDQRQQMEPQVAALLHPNEHDHIRRPNSVNRNWLAVNLPIIRRSVRRVKKRSARGMHSLRTYFTAGTSEP